MNHYDHHYESDFGELQQSLTSKVTVLETIVQNLSETVELTSRAVLEVNQKIDKLDQGYDGSKTYPPAPKMDALLVDPPIYVPREETAQDMAKRNYAERASFGPLGSRVVDASEITHLTNEVSSSTDHGYCQPLSSRVEDDKVNPKTLAGSKKPPLHLIPPTALIQLSRAMELGANKYGPFNWRDKAVPVLTYLAAAQRHILSYLDGEETDPESGAPHLAHAMACMAIVLDAKEVEMLIDDRPRLGRTGQLIQELTKNV